MINLMYEKNYEGRICLYRLEDGQQYLIEDFCNREKMLEYIETHYNYANLICINY